MTTVRVFHPDVRVTLYKTVQRDKVSAGVPVSARYRSSEQVIDLTQYLADGSALRTTKSVRDPAGGFSLTFADAPNKGALGFESMYALIEPMDFVEIRMRHGEHGANTPAGDPPVVMRGFVSSVGRSESIGPDGKPARSVIVSGQDYGKLWQMLQILYLPGYIVGEDTLSSFRLFEKFGAGFKTGQSGADFLREVITKVLNPYIDKLMPANSPNPREVLLDRISVAHGTTSLSGSQNQEGTIYNLLQTYLDVGIWNELFLEDDDEGVHCVYRPNPYRTLAGDKIQSDAPDAEIVTVPGSDVISLSVERSDADVANYYWVRGARFDLNTEVFRKQFEATGQSRDSVILDTYQNSSSSIYGIRAMFVDTQMGGDDVSAFTTGLPKTEQDRRDTSVANWINDRRRILVEQNKDNVVMERGFMRVRGNEQLRAGVVARLWRGDFAADYYVVQASHEFIPFQGFFTTLAVERGTGFAERAKREGGPASPYLAELKDL